MASKQTDEKRRFLIETRGYPMGYHSKEEYEFFLEKNTPKVKVCVECGEQFEGLEKDLQCSDQCKKTYRRKKTEKTCLERYGDTHFSRNACVRDKTKQTCLERYGVGNPQQSREIKQKTKDTCIERYGNYCHLNSVEYTEKRRQSLLEKYGVDNYFKRTDLVKESWQNTLGCDNPQKNKEIDQKRRLTLSKKYTLLGAVPKDASEKTCFERYGSKMFFSSEAGRMSINNLRDRYGWTEDRLVELMRKRRSSVKFGRASKESLKVFIPLYKWLRKRGYARDDILFGISGSYEFSLLKDSCIYYYDFLIKPLNLIIEFNGILFHARKDTDILLYNHSAEDIIKKDEIKRSVAIENGFEILTLWSDEPHLLNRSQIFINKIEEEVMKKFKDFIKEKTSKEKQEEIAKKERDEKALTDVAIQKRGTILPSEEDVNG